MYDFSIKFGKRIRELREQLEISQQKLSELLNVSRPAISQIESGERKISAEELKKLSEIFHIPLDSLLNLEKEPEIILEEAEKREVIKPQMRINVPQKNLGKFKEVLLYILNKVGSKSNIGETVVYKLLYFIDFDFYEKFEEQLVGATYIKNNYGPTPVEFKVVVDDMIKNGEIVKVEGKYFNYPQRKYLPIREPDLTKLKDARELHHIDEVIARLGDKNATELSEYSHEDTPWLLPKENQPLDYEAVFYRTPKTSVRNYDEQD